MKWKVVQDTNGVYMYKSKKYDWLCYVWYEPSVNGFVFECNWTLKSNWYLPGPDYYASSWNKQGWKSVDVAKQACERWVEKNKVPLKDRLIDH